MLLCKMLHYLFREAKCVFLLSYFLFISVRYHFQPIICFITPSATFPPLLQDYPPNIKSNKVFIFIFSHTCLHRCVYICTYLQPVLKDFNVFFFCKLQTLKMAANSETDIATLCFLVFIGRSLHTAAIIRQIRQKLQLHIHGYYFPFYIPG